MSDSASHNSVPILRIDRLSYLYPNGRRALSDVSFSVGLGETVGVIGPNGAGKTTLLLHLNGLLASRPRRIAESPQADSNGHGAMAGAPTAGPAIEVLGLPVVPENLGEVRRVVGFLFQDPDDQLFCSTVEEDVAFGPLNLGFPKPEVRRRVADSLAAVGLSGFETRSPRELSFGERRRAALAGVLACEPNLLALDEPSSNLDPRARRGLVEILKTCEAAQVVASHDLELILEICSRVIVLDAGRVCADGPTREVLSNERLMLSHGLEVPLSIRLAR